MFSFYYFEKIVENRIFNFELKKVISESIGVLWNEKKCPECSSNLIIYANKTKSIDFRYHCKICKKNFSIRTFTPFVNLRVDLPTILQTFALFVSNTSVAEIKEKTKLSDATVIKILGIARDAMKKYVDGINSKLGDNGRVVEIEETLIAKKRKYNRGRVNDQQWLFGAIERNGGMAIIKTVDKRDSVTLDRIIMKYINDNATVYSDEWRAYIKFFSENASYNHSTINHSQNFVHPEHQEIHTQNIEAFWGIFKRWLKKKSYSRRNSIEYYIAEFLFTRSHSNIDKYALLKLEPRISERISGDLRISTDP